jgi:hypothetical protein
MRKPHFPIPREEDESPATSDDDEDDHERPSGVCFRVLEESGMRPTLPQLPAQMLFLRRIPVLAVPLAELQVLPLDHRAAFVLSRIDGVSNVEMILDVCAMKWDEALLILDELIDLGVIRLT